MRNSISLLVAAFVTFSAARMAQAQFPGGGPAPGATDVAASVAPLPRSALHLGLLSLEVEQKDVHGLSFSLVADRVAQLSGVQWSMALNQVTAPSSGVQLTGIANLSRDFSGVQLSSGLNWAEGKSRGLQLAASLNVAGGGGGGVQLAGANFSGGTYHGFQGGVVNGAQSFRGMQLGPVNVAQDVSGVQLGVVNVARRNTGSQVGVVNVADHSRGFTFGLVNVARQHDGEALGLLSFIGNGIHDVAVYSSDVMLSNVSVKLGGRHLYTSWSVGYHPGDDIVGAAGQFDSDSRRLGLGLGLGYRLDLGWGRVRFLELEASSMSVVSKMKHMDDDPPLLTAGRLVLGIELTRQITLIAGVTQNVAIGWQGRDLDISVTGLEKVNRDGGTTVRTFPGALLGLQL